MSVSSYLSSVTVGVDPVNLPAWQPLAVLSVNKTEDVVLEFSGCPPGLGITLTVYVNDSLLRSLYSTPRFIFKSTVLPSEFIVTREFEGWRGKCCLHGYGFYSSRVYKRQFLPYAWVWLFWSLTNSFRSDPIRFRTILWISFCGRAFFNWPVS